MVRPCPHGHGTVSPSRPRGARAFAADTRTSQRFAPVGCTYGVGDAEAEAPAEALAEEVLVAGVLVEGALAEAELTEGALAEETFADDPLAEEVLAGEAPVGPALIVRTTGALGRASVPAAGSVPVTVRYSSGPCTDRMAATV